MARTCELSSTGRRGLDLDPDILKAVDEKKDEEDEEIRDYLHRQGYNVSMGYVRSARKKLKSITCCCS